MAATGGQKQEDNHFGSESLWIPAGGGGQRGERRVGEIVKEEKKVSNPGPTSMVVSWVGRCKARVNLNGGELDFECATGTHKGGHRRKEAPSQSQPKWWRAGPIGSRQTLCKKSRYNPRKQPTKQTKHKKNQTKIQKPAQR